jgi:glycosyltransferase involved in cell wall biosynthesis
MGPAERPPHLSVVLVVGSQRRRAQRVLDALAAQTAADCIEVVVVDLIDDGLTPLHVAPFLRHVYARRPDINRWGRARAEAVRLASADVIGFIEDHCFPEPEWAAMLIEAYRGPWAAVGYAFTNANPRTYVSRASMLARYGQFVDPARPGPARIVSGNNVSYRRDLLLSFGSELDGLLTIDFNLQEVLGKRGLQLLVEARARAAHTNFSNYARDTITGYWYCRLLAARRAETQSWSTTRRLVHGFGAPLGSPAIRLARLLFGLRGRSLLWAQAAAAIPLIVGWYVTDAVGESSGYLFGPGQSELQALRWELNEAREGEV